MNNPLVAVARDRFAAVFDAVPRAESPWPLAALAPGRVNLIGEHVDYNDGLVLPMAIDRHVAVAFAPRMDGTLRAHATAFGETRAARIADLEPGSAGIPAPGSAADPRAEATRRPVTGAAADGVDAWRAPAHSAVSPPRGHWFAYVAGVAWALREAGLTVPGADLVIASDIPIAAGLASSAALELATARALCAVATIPWTPAAMAALCQHAESAYVGTRCGPMDQHAAACAREGCALLLDCRTLAYEAVPLAAGATIVAMDTAVPRALAASAYNERRRSCEEAVRRLRAAIAAGDPQRGVVIRALRDVTPELLESCRAALRAPATPGDDGERLYRRVRHVVEEIPRPARLADALRAGDFEAAGRLLDESHASLRDLFGVSCAELDLITDLARAHPACFGARMTGAGFGGCAIALVQTARAAGFAAEVGGAYRSRTGRPGALFPCRPAAAAALVE
jgi:galactokinase